MNNQMPQKDLLNYGNQFPLLKNKPKQLTEFKKNDTKMFELFDNYIELSHLVEQQKNKIADITSILDIIVSHGTSLENELSYENERVTQNVNLYEFIVNTSNDYMLLVDNHYLIVAVNDAFCGALQMHRSDILHKSIEDLLGPYKFRRYFKKALFQCQSCNEIKSNHFFRIGKKRRQHFEMNFFPFYNSKARIKKTLTHYVIIIHDITKRVNNENEKLLLEEQLHQSLKLKAIGEFASSIAHDFTNILQLVKSGLNMIEYKAQDSLPFEAYMETAKNAVKKGNDLIEKLLLYCQHKSIKRREVDMVEIIKESTDLIRTIAPKSVQIHFNIHELAMKVYSDSTEIQQIIMNLTINAVSAMKGKGGKLVIELMPFESSRDIYCVNTILKKGAFALLKVKDSGCGIDTKQMKRIFEPFFSTKPDGKGNGLGLSTVYGIVNNLNGGIRVQSTPGIGTTFSIYFPTINNPDSNQNSL